VLTAAPRTGWTPAQRAVLLVTCLGQFVTQLDLTVVNVAVSGVKADFGVSTGLVTWMIDGYLVTFAAFLLSLGDLADLLGRKRLFLAGLALFTVASAGCAAAPGMGWLIGARAVQGIAGAAVLVSSLALLMHDFQGSERTRAIGWWASVAGVALIAGPLLGGVLVDSLGWRWIFWINLPVGVLAITAGSRTLTESRRASGTRFDWPGQLLAVALLGTLAYGLEGRAWPALVAAGFLAAGFVLMERHSAHPLVPLEVFRSRAFTGANLAAGLLNFGTLGLLFLLSLYVEQVEHGPAAAAGSRIAPLFAAYVLTNPWAGRAQRRWGTAWSAGLGTGLAGLAALAVPGLVGQPVWTTVALAGCGAGVGLAMPALVSVAVTAVPAERSGLASGLNNTARQIGNTLGIALLGGVADAARSLRSGIEAALVVNGCAFLLAAVLIAVSCRTVASPRGRRPDGTAEPAPIR
jgi:DHA2 family methylenomycin A resistance protein-like MFS transporter